MDPLKEYALLGCILAIVGAVVWFAHDERAVGEAKIIAAQQTADAKEAIRVKQVEDNANTTIQGLQLRYAAALASPPHPSVVVRMCHSAPAPAASGDPSAGSQGPGAGGSGSGVGSGDQSGADIAPLTEAILKRDQSLIEYLQGYVKTCQKAGACGT